MSGDMRGETVPASAPPQASVLNNDQVADYLADMAAELVRLVPKTRGGLLSFLLGMVVREARSLVRS